jgi:hypothetical protein
LAWLAKESKIEKLLPEGMVKPEKRTEEHVTMVVDHWLEHGELSIVAKRVKTYQRNRFTQQRDRAEPGGPWVVTMTMSNAMMSSGKRLGINVVGQEVLGFERRNAPLEIQSRMKQQIQAWRIGKRTAERDQSGGGGSSSRGSTNTASTGGSAERVLQPERKRSAAWGLEPVGGWTLDQTKRWEEEQEASEAAAAAMEERVNKAVTGFQKDPEALSKKTGAIKKMGVKPDHKLVEKLVAQVVAYRQESWEVKSSEILHDKGVSMAVRKMVEEHEAKH